MNIQHELTEPLVAHITLSLTPPDYMPQVEENLKKAAKTAEIKGFRKGFVPKDLIKKMYGNGIMAEVIEEQVQQNITQYIKEQQLETFMRPSLIEENKNLLDILTPTEVIFEFEVGLTSPFSTDLDPNKPLTKYKITVTDDILEEAIGSARKSFGEYQDSDTVVEDGYVEAEFTPCDADGKELADVKSSQSSLIMSWFDEDMKAKLLKAKVGDVFYIDNIYTTIAKSESEIKKHVLNITDDHNPGEKFNMRIISAKSLKEAELNEEFYKKAFPSQEISTEQEFRDHMRQDYEKYFDQRTQHHLEHEVYHYMMENIAIDMSDSYIQKYFSREQGRELTSEEVQDVKKQFKWEIIKEKYLQLANAQITFEELKKYALVKLRAQNQNLFYYSDEQLLSMIDRQFKEDQKTYENYYMEWINDAVTKYILDHAKIDIKEVTLDEFKTIVEDHNHQFHNHDHAHEHEHEHHDHA